MTVGASQIGYGITLKWKTVLVAKLTKIGEFGFEVNKVDVTTFDSAIAFKEYVAGLIDPGDFTIEGYLSTADTTGQMVMFTDARARTTGAALITLPTTLGTATFTGTALITDIKIGDIVNEQGIPFKAKLSFMGATTWSSAA